MDAIQFVMNYTLYLEEIEQAVKPEYYPVIQELKGIDPHEFVRPDTWFLNDSAARGYVWTMFLNEKQKLTSRSST